MKDNHGRYRKHIKAAKDWLGRAEDSIDKDNDIRVDLDVMLAQAELQRAKEANELKLWRRWLYWTVPWVLAVMVAAGYFFLLRLLCYTRIICPKASLELQRCLFLSRKVLPKVML